MRVLFSSTWGIGHVFPMVPLARAFRDAGHDVLWVTNETAVDRVRAAGIDVRVGGLDAVQLADVRRRLAEGTADLAGPDKARFAFPHMFGEWATPAMARDLLAVAREWRPDLLVHEPAELASALVGAVIDVRSVTHSWGGAIPAGMFSAAAEKLTGLWAEHGLQVAPLAGAARSTYLDVCPPSVQTVSLDYVGDRQAMRPGLYSGEAQASAPFAPDEEGRPLVYVTLGTVRTYGDVLRATIDGVARCDVRAVVTVGPDGDPAALEPFPDGVMVLHWVAQSDVLPRASAVVSHCGSGTFLGALGAGLPQVCLPQAADQFRNAEGVVSSGAGFTLHPGEVTPEAVALAVDRVLTEDRFRECAGAVGAEMAAMPSPDEVVSILTG